MTPRVIPAALCLWPLLLAAPLQADPFVSAPQTVGGVTARLVVQVAEQAPAPGTALLRLTALVRGGTDLEVGDLEIEDPRKAWKVRLPLSSWALEGDRVVWNQGVELLQVEPGRQPLPTVRLTFRPGPGEGWEEVEWTDLLREPRPGPEPVLSPDPDSSRWTHLWPLALGGPVILGVLLVVGYWGWRQTRTRPVPPLTARERALRDLQRLQEDEALRADPRRFHTALSDRIRGFLAERLGVRAPQQTSAEFLAVAGQLPGMTEDQRTLLREFCERCDLAKFAPSSLGAQTCGESTELAKRLIAEVEPGPQPEDSQEGPVGGR